jgi:hypothetical protein
MAKQLIEITSEMRTSMRKTFRHNNEGAERRKATSAPAQRFLPRHRARARADFKWEFVTFEGGAKSAFKQLKERSDNAYVELAKGYFIFSSEHYGSPERALSDMEICNMRCLKPMTVGCLVLGDSEYLFFWTAKS